MNSWNYIAPLTKEFFLGIFLILSFGCNTTKEIPIAEETTPVEQQEEAVAEIEEDTADVVNEEEQRKQQLIEVYKTELNDKYGADANRLTSLYIQAQQRFFNGDYQSALILINRANEINETADILALKGSIYLGLGSREAFVENWRKALTMDADVPIPPSPIIVRLLKENGLITENLERNF